MRDLGARAGPPSPSVEYVPVDDAGDIMHIRLYLLEQVQWLPAPQLHSFAAGQQRVLSNAVMHIRLYLLEQVQWLPAEGLP